MSTTSLFFTPPAVGASELNDLSDVTITGTPNDNDALAYDTASGKFIPQALAGGGVSVLNDLTDVNTDTSGITNINGHLLTYDTATSTYIPRDEITITTASGLAVNASSVYFDNTPSTTILTSGDTSTIEDMTNAANQIKDNGTDLNIESGLLFVDKTNSRVGVQQGTPTSTLHVVGSSNVMTPGSVGIVSDDTDGVQIYGKSGVTNKLDQDWEVTSSGKLTAPLLVSGQFVSAIAIGGSPASLLLDLRGVSYVPFSCSTAGAASLDNLNISNDIAGSQAVIFITCTISAMTINLVGGTNVKTGYPSQISMLVNDTAVMTMCSDGTNRYVNCVKYT